MKRDGKSTGTSLKRSGYFSKRQKNAKWIPLLSDIIPTGSKRLAWENNQNFVQIPFNKLISAIENKCVKEGIRFFKQEESYTSQASFLDMDRVPVWSKDHQSTEPFSGKRITRGLYRSKSGKCIHADITAAFNSLRKSAVVAIEEKLTVQTPVRFMVQKRKAVASRIA